MKRNRFSQMIPPTPADFHASVQDALNRMESQERRGRTLASALRMTAAVAAAFVLVIGLAVALRSRPAVPDRVTTAVENVTVRPTEMASETAEDPVTVEIGDWRVTEDGSIELDWSISAVEGDTLLFSADADLLSGGESVLQGFESFSMMGESTAMFVHLGEDVLGVGNGAEIERTGRILWMEGLEKWEKLTLAIHFDVYRPTAAFLNSDSHDGTSFEDSPRWWVTSYAGDYFGAEPIDWYSAGGVYNAGIGSRYISGPWTDYFNAHSGEKFGSAAEAQAAMKAKGEFRTALLEAFGFAQHVMSFDFAVEIDVNSAD